MPNLCLPSRRCWSSYWRALHRALLHIPSGSCTILHQRWVNQCKSKTWRNENWQQTIQWASLKFNMFQHVPTKKSLPFHLLVTTSWCSKVLLAQSSDRQRADTSEFLLFSSACFGAPLPGALYTFSPKVDGKADRWTPLKGQQLLVKSTTEEDRRSLSVCWGIVWEDCDSFFEFDHPEVCWILLSWLMFLPLLFVLEIGLHPCGCKRAADARVWQRGHLSYQKLSRYKIY